MLPNVRAAWDRIIAQEKAAAEAWEEEHEQMFDPVIQDGTNWTVKTDLDRDPTRMQSLIPMHQWRGRWHMSSRLSEFIPCLELRCTRPEVSTEKYRYPPNCTIKVPSSVNNIPMGSPPTGVRTIYASGAAKPRTHAAAGHGYIHVTHPISIGPARRCMGQFKINGKPYQCQCKQDWQPWATWKPWDNPPVAELERWEPLRQAGFLTHYLKRLLWIFKQSEPNPPMGDFKSRRSVSYFLLADEDGNRTSIDRRTTTPETCFEIDVPRRPRYARRWEQFFRKGAEITKPAAGLFKEIIAASGGKVPKRIGIDIEYTILKRDPTADHTPYYMTHDSNEDVQAYLNCSRATAFRRIEEGFRIPEQYRRVSPRLAVARDCLQGQGAMRPSRPPTWTIRRAPIDTVPKTSGRPVPEYDRGWESAYVYREVRTARASVPSFYGPPLPPCDCEQCRGVLELC